MALVIMSTLQTVIWLVERHSTDTIRIPITASGPARSSDNVNYDDIMSLLVFLASQRFFLDIKVNKTPVVIRFLMRTVRTMIEEQMVQYENFS